MKAAVYDRTGPPEVLYYSDAPDPALRRGGLTVDVAAVGIQGGDTLHRGGGVLASVPHIVGYQAAGVVRAVGEGVTGFEPGQPVVATMAHGSHAEIVSVPAGSAWHVPDGLSLREAAGVPIEFGTAHDCLFEFGRLSEGETVLVQAAGSGVGIAAVQLAKAAGATVIGTASSDEKLARLADLGLDHGINYLRDDVAGSVREITGGRGADLVVDSVGGSVLEGSVASLAYRGRISWVGRAGREARPPDVAPIMQKNASISGVFLGAEMAINPDRTHPMIASLLARCASGELRVVIDSEFPLAEAAAAHAHVEDRRSFGRVLLIP